MTFRRMEFITRQFVKDNPDCVFLFGDNVARVGFGGQAREMRGEPNTIGIVTKKRPAWNDTAFFTDSEYEENCRLIDNDFERVDAAAKAGKIIVAPVYGIGTGRAAMRNHAPETFLYLCRKLQEHINKHQRGEY